MQLLDKEVFILKSCQAELMPQEIQKLLNNEQITDKTMKSLDPFLDVNTILCVGGRLRRAPFDYNEKHPMILPKYGHLTQLIIKHYHERHNIKEEALQLVPYAPMVSTLLGYLDL